MDEKQSMEMIDERYFTIAEISRRLKVPKHTIRFWEKEFCGHILPIRTEGGQRRYTAENISIIQKIKKLREKGMSLAEIKRRLAARETDGDGKNSKIDRLANRVAEVVKTEVYNFLAGEEGDR